VNLVEPAAGLREAIAGGYVLVLLGAGLTLLIYQWIKQRGVPPPPGLAPWRAGWLNFFLWLWVLLAADFLSHAIAYAWLGPLPEAARHDPTSDPAAVIPRLALAEIVLLAAQVALIRSRSAWSPAPVNRTALSPGRVLAETVPALLKAFPLMLLAAAVWRVVLNVAQHWLPGLQTPPQDPLELLAQTHQPLALAALVFSAVVLAPMNEELMFRAGLYRFCKGRLGATQALVLVNLVFASAHWNLLSFLPLFVLGCLLTRAYERSGNIAVPMLFHALFNLNTIALLLYDPRVLDPTAFLR
jgi:hypothetical protein